MSNVAARPPGGGAEVAHGAWRTPPPLTAFQIASSQAWKFAADVYTPPSSLLPRAPQALANLAFAFARASYASPPLLSAVRYGAGKG